MRIAKCWPIFFSFAAMLLLIFDTKTYISGASDAVAMCIQTVIPSLFPFLILSVFLTGQLSAYRFKWLTPLGKLLHLPEGSETIFLIGILGGYPVGAQCIRLAYDAGTLSREDAQRMLCFCNNAGPAFIFGIGGHLLGKEYLCGVIWCIHIISALIIGLVMTPEKQSSDVSFPSQPVLFTDSVRKAAEAISMICCWIILFRILLGYMDKWILEILPQPIYILLTGLLELANGCVSLDKLADHSLRFILLSTMLGYGGVCVALQTKSVLSGVNLNIRPFIVGKVYHGILSFLISTVSARLLFKNAARDIGLLGIFCLFLLITIVSLRQIKAKRGLAFYCKIM